MVLNCVLMVVVLLFFLITVILNVTAFISILHVALCCFLSNMQVNLNQCVRCGSLLLLQGVVGDDASLGRSTCLVFWPPVAGWPPVCWLACTSRPQHQSGAAANGSWRSTRAAKDLAAKYDWPNSGIILVLLNSTLHFISSLYALRCLDGSPNNAC